jgi:DinB superfamily
MSTANPYEKFLEGRKADEIIAATPATLAGLIDAIGPAKSTEPPAPGKWSPAQIIAHLADCELVFAFRLRQTLAEDNHTIQPFDQDKWAVQYEGISAAQALDVFKALRGWNQHLLRKALPQAAGRKVSHPERGTMTFQTIVETMAGHDLNHIGQLQRIAGQKD